MSILLNNKYRIPANVATVVVSNLKRFILDTLPTEAITITVSVEELFTKDQVVAVVRTYDIDQLDGRQLKGKPKTISVRIEDKSLAFGYTPVVEITKLLPFLGYHRLGTLTQVKTGFMLSDPLIDIPITLSETNELGTFLEIGNVAGPIQDIEQLLAFFQQSTKISDHWLEPRSLVDLMSIRQANREAAK